MKNGKRRRRPVVRWHGGKWRAAPWIISHFPNHRTYVEPFGGGASVLIRKERSTAEIYNDRAGNIVNVFRVLRDHAGELERLLLLTPYAREEFESALDPSPDPIEQARRTLVRSFMGYGSASASEGYSAGFRANNNKVNRPSALDWLNYPQEVELFARRLQGVVIENRDYREVLEQQDADNALFYCDPPYVRDTRAKSAQWGKGVYQYEMSLEEHAEFLRLAKRLEGYVLISGYDCELYRDELAEWRLEVRPALADGARARLEHLWISPNTPPVQHELLRIEHGNER